MALIDRTKQLATLERELAIALLEYGFHGTIGLHDSACIAIDAYVDALVASGQPPERVVIAIKRVAGSAGYAPVRLVPRRDAVATRDLRLDAFVSRAIYRYFREDFATVRDALMDTSPSAGA